MRPKHRVIVFLVVIIVLICLFLSKSYRDEVPEDSSEPKQTDSLSFVDVQKPEIAVVVVVCENRSDETLVMIKSALLLTKSSLHFYLFADEIATVSLRNRLEEWQLIVNRSYAFEIRPVEFPSGEFHSDWRKLFKPCASQRLFLPALLQDVDSVLYVDTDTIFLGPVEQVWNHFLKMNTSQIAALAPEDEDINVGWYNRFARHPFYKPMGVNTGVMLMNLTRMRSFGWDSYLQPIYKQYKTKIPWGDQDIINIIFSFHPDKLYLYGCNYNFRADLCMYSNVCKAVEQEGVIVLHGSRAIFHNDKHPPFRIVYQAVQQYDWTTDSFPKFMTSLKEQLNSVPSTQCGIIAKALYKNLEKFENISVAQKMYKTLEKMGNSQG